MLAEKYFILYKKASFEKEFAGHPSEHIFLSFLLSARGPKYTQFSGGFMSDVPFEFSFCREF